MKPIFHLDLKAILKSRPQIVVELGCGPNKPQGRIGVDRLDLPGVDIVADLEEGLPFFPDNSVDLIYSSHLLEHVNNLGVLMYDIWRVLKPEGRKHLVVPHFSNPHYYSDYTHTRFFGLYSFEYFSKSQTRFQRKVPNFYQEYGFHTDHVRLLFNSHWLSRRIIRRAAQVLFNLSGWWQELYEENFCYIIPCDSIEVTLRPDKSIIVSPPERPE